MYRIEDFNGLGRPRVVRMSFELPYLDWCIFEKTELFQLLTTYLKELQNQESQHEEAQTIDIDTTNIDETMEKVNQLNESLEKTRELISSLFMVTINNYFANEK